jgi:C4-dicarboxylate-specific signal transduction histidine kinase
MHLQEIFNAIYSNHNYEYFVVDEHYNIIEHSDKSVDYCTEMCTNLFACLPELYGMEENMHAVRSGRLEKLTMENIAKLNDEYINIHVCPGKKNENEESYETLVVLIEIVTDKAKTKQYLVQERNEKSLILSELERKNNQLNQLNKEMEMRVEEATRKYIEKSRMVELRSRHAQMGEMIGMITHQWKQPISAAYLLIHIMKTKWQESGFDYNASVEKLDQLKQLLGHMDDTIHAFQAFFNPGRQRKQFVIYEAIKDILKLVEYPYKLENIFINVEGDRSLKAVGYPNEFSQVILSLLQNAKEAFLQHPKEDMHINIVLEKDNKHSVIRVRDNAGGIPESIIDTIFEPYTTTKSNGSGIGLNIVRTIIEENMKGTIEVRNIDDGAEFVIRL